MKVSTIFDFFLVGIFAFVLVIIVLYCVGLYPFQIKAEIVFLLPIMIIYAIVRAAMHETNNNIDKDDFTYD